ncbi:MAG: LysM peptidoglycan-binding domain-containing protein [Ignavibacteriae bacterium]|nr:LysM peptidoglycan-binding domain-containing protein [Ignavibacteriota bacterium]
MNKNKYIILKALFAVTAFYFIGATALLSQTVKQNTFKKPKNETETFYIFPDEYSELDEVPLPSADGDERIKSNLEKSRQKYVQALAFVQSKDTVNAIKSFENAIQYLNNISSFPNIKQNSSFNELAHSISEDYETFIKDLDNLDDESQLFIIRDRFYRQVEKIEPKIFPKFKQLELQKEIKNKEGKTIAGEVSKNPNVIKELTIPLVENEYVQKSLTFLTENPGRKFFIKWLERSGKWFPMMRRIAHEEEVPEELIFLSMIESGLNPNAVSRAQAVGLWQFIRSTGELYGLNDTPSVWMDERREPEKSTRAAMRHLRDLFSEFGDWHLALAAYNCGNGGVRRAMKKFDNDSIPLDFWTIREKLPRETRNYVPLYIAAAKIALNPEEYGIKISEIKFDDEYKYDTFILKEPVSLSVLSKCLDQNSTEDEIKKMNPELIRAFTPPDVTDYVLKIPKGKKELFTANFNQLTPEEKQPWFIHPVEKGETISSISRKYDIPKTELVDANNLKGYKVKLQPGTELRIPVKFSDIAQNFRNGNGNSNDNGSDLGKSNGNSQDDSIQIIHTVKKGETLYSISNSYRVLLDDLKLWNNLPQDSNNIASGSKLIINTYKPGKPKLTSLKGIIADSQTYHSTNEKDTLKVKNNNIKESQISQNTDSESDTQGSKPIKKEKSKSSRKHKVRNGDTLSLIAKRYGVSVNSLVKANKNIKPDKLRIGQVIKIH